MHTLSYSIFVSSLDLEPNKKKQRKERKNSQMVGRERRVYKGTNEEWWLCPKNNRIFERGSMYYAKALRSWRWRAVYIMNEFGVVELSCILRHPTPPPILYWIFLATNKQMHHNINNKTQVGRARGKVAVVSRKENQPVYISFQQNLYQMPKTVWPVLWTMMGKFTNSAK